VTRFLQVVRVAGFSALLIGAEVHAEQGSTPSPADALQEHIHSLGGMSKVLQMPDVAEHLPTRVRLTLEFLLTGPDAQTAVEHYEALRRATPRLQELLRSGAIDPRRLASNSFSSSASRHASVPAATASSLAAQAGERCATLPERYGAYCYDDYLGGVKIVHVGGGASGHERRYEEIMEAVDFRARRWTKAELDDHIVREGVPRDAIDRLQVTFEADERLKALLPDEKWNSVSAPRSGPDYSFEPKRPDGPYLFRKEKPGPLGLERMFNERAAPEENLRMFDERSLQEIERIQKQPGSLK